MQSAKRVQAWCVRVRSLPGSAHVLDVKGREKDAHAAGTHIAHLWGWLDRWTWKGHK